MTDWPDATNPAGDQPASKSRPATDQPGYVDGIPVEELVRMTREFTARITNEDRQRLTMELSETGHQRTIQTSAPFLLQQFFTGRVDLDVELARRYPASPLLSSPSFTPEPGTRTRHGYAQFMGQDNAAAMTVELRDSGAIEVSFLLQSMIAIRFNLSAITDVHRKRFLELMRRPNGIAFLWTRERWENDYLIFVVREHFARVYAFGPGRYDAACRLTPDCVEQLMAWLAAFWSAGEEPPPQEELPSSALTW